MLDMTSKSRKLKEEICVSLEPCSLTRDQIIERLTLLDALMFKGPRMLKNHKNLDATYLSKFGTFITKKVSEYRKMPFGYLRILYNKKHKNKI